MVLACSSGAKDEVQGEDSTGSSVAIKHDTCEVDHTRLFGELTSNNINEALRQARRLTKKGNSDQHGAGANVSTITAICESHGYNMSGNPQLDSGQFVAVIDIVGVDPVYSDERDDIVYLWIYLNADSGQYATQFLSTKGRKAPKGGPMDGCAKQPAKEEAAHWTPSRNCPRTVAVSEDLSQHTPWWGCWLGCCYVSDES
jgi:hypothetical protein